ncbi:hypothetical protein EGW08_020880 [Elysia chlorotica]|uniref:Uncharacterized protein n=1 Tax=Elysia chlorotica TaxID=188477 RepID=A0A3S1H397_ELYCH|nr:hypothetical protein EGW08_020880 [Elysia chlorotica]
MIKGVSNFLWNCNSKLFEGRHIIKIRVVKMVNNLPCQTSFKKAILFMEIFLKKKLFEETICLLLVFVSVIMEFIHNRNKSSMPNLYQVQVRIIEFGKTDALCCILKNLILRVCLMYFHFFHLYKVPLC